MVSFPDYLNLEIERTHQLPVVPLKPVQGHPSLLRDQDRPQVLLRLLNWVHAAHDFRRHVLQLPLPYLRTALLAHSASFAAFSPSIQYLQVNYSTDLTSSTYHQLDFLILLSPSSWTKEEIREISKQRSTFYDLTIFTLLSIRYSLAFSSYFQALERAPTGTDRQKTASFWSVKDLG